MFDRVISCCGATGRSKIPKRPRDSEGQAVWSRDRITEVFTAINDCQRNTVCFGEIPINTFRLDTPELRCVSTARSEGTTLRCVRSTTTISTNAECKRCVDIRGAYVTARGRWASACLHGPTLSTGLRFSISYSPILFLSP